jgi:hypothetical protein
MHATEIKATYFKKILLNINIYKHKGVKKTEIDSEVI